MEYRKLPRGEEQISILALGGARKDVYFQIHFGANY